MEEKKNDNLATELLHHLAVQNKRLFIALVTILVIFFVENLAWLYVWQSYDYTSYDYSQDGNGENTLNSNIGGDVYNGAEAKSSDEDKEKSFSGQRDGNKEAKKEEINGN